MLGDKKALAGGQVHGLPLAVLTNHHPHLGASDNVHFFSSSSAARGQRWVSLGSAKVLAEPPSSWHPQGGESVFCLFKLLETTCVPRLTGFFLHPHGQPPGCVPHPATPGSLCPSLFHSGGPV